MSFVELRDAPPQARKAVITILCIIGFTSLLGLIGKSIVTEDLKSTVLLGLALAVFVTAGKIASDWRTGVYALFVWLVLEDLVRKYMGNSMAVYFGKDILVGITYLSFLKARSCGGFARFHPPFRFALSVFVLLGLVQVFNPNSPSIVYGLLGVKLYFYYIPLMFVGYAFIRTEADLCRFFVANIGLAGIVALIGIIQAMAGLEFLNPHGGKDIDALGHLTRYSRSGLAVPRPPSVFVSDGRFASYLVLAFIVGVGTAGYLLLRTTSGRKIVFPAVALVGVAAMMSGSRSSLMFVGASLLVLSAGVLWGAPARGEAAYRVFKAIRRTWAAVALALVAMITIFPQQITAPWTFYQETLFPDSPDFELSGRLGTYPGGEFLVALSDPNWMIGHGIGTASLGGQYVSRIIGVIPTGVGAESGYGTLILELGVLGLGLWLVWTVSLVIAACRVVLNLRGTWAFPLSLSLTWFTFVLLFPYTFVGMQPYQNYVLNAYLWLLVGILFRLPTLVAGDFQPSH
jgi:hypothetical protein